MAGKFTTNSYRFSGGVSHTIALSAAGVIRRAPVTKGINLEAEIEAMPNASQGFGGDIIAAGTKGRTGSIGKIAKRGSFSLGTDQLYLGQACTLQFSTSDIECFDFNGVKNLIESRSPTLLSKSSSLNKDVLGSILGGSGSFPDLSPIESTEIESIATRGGQSPYPYYILAKINYKSPCDINGAKFKLGLSDAVPLCLFGKLNDAAGNPTVGAASGKLIGCYRNDVEVGAQEVSFLPAGGGATVSKAANSTLFCWVLFGGGIKSGSNDQFSYGGEQTAYSHGYGYGSDTASNFECPDSILVENWEATKPDWVVGNMDGFIGSNVFQAIESAQGPSAGWTSSIWAVAVSSVFKMAATRVTFPFSPAPEDMLGWADINSNGKVDIADAVALINWLQQTLESGDITQSTTTFHIQYPKMCCDEEASEKAPNDKPEKETIQESSCSADLEILDVRCGPAARIYVGNAAQASASTEKSSVISALSSLQSITLRGIEQSAAVLSVGSNDGPCDDLEGVVSEGDENYMIIVVGMKNEASVAGFQFDVGFNKYSSAPLASCNAMGLQPAMFSGGWNLVSKAFDDRFGYDRVIRVLGWQPLIDFSNERQNKGFNVQDEDFMAGLQTSLSLNASSGGYETLAAVMVQFAPATSCPCPKRRLFIDGNLESVGIKSKLQRNKPALFTVGKEWSGPAIIHKGRWWTASADTGKPTWTKSSIPLVVRWDGIELLNKRVVTNETTKPVRHASYGLKYYGEYVGLHAHVPESYSSLIDFFTGEEGITPWVLKALHNGLDSEWPRADASKYEFMWGELYNRYKLSVEDESEQSLTALQQLTYQNYMKNYAGFIDDANLDGKFDVADLVALHNSAQMRLLFPNPTFVSDSTVSATLWKKPPTNWVLASKQIDLEAFNKVMKVSGIGKLKAGSGVKVQKSQIAQMQARIFSDNSGRYRLAGIAAPNKQSPSTSIVKESIPNISRIVPSYCLNTFCTETYPDHCPAIVGGDYAETSRTLSNKIGDCESSGKNALQYFSQRIDILPNKQATAKFAFSGQPATNSSFKIQDTAGQFENLKFSSQANGTDLDGGYKAIKIGTNLDTTVANVLSWFSSGTQTGITAVAIGSSPNRTGFILKQAKEGATGNSKIIYRGTQTNLVDKQENFSKGSSYLTNLRPSYRTWAEYFKSQNSIANTDLYENEEVYGEDGATYFEVKTSLNCENQYSHLTPLVGFVARADATINFCGGYDASTVVRVKILPGDGFKMVDVYDAETGALLTASTSTQYNNFYTVPNHGKINIISHNFNSSKQYRDTKVATTSNSKYFTPITQDGGALVIAKVFVTPMPDWESGKYIELMCGKNNILGGNNLSLSTGFKEPIGRWQDLLPSEAYTAGPKTSQFSQNYRDNSSSLHTYADYMLHTEVVGPKHIRIKYNTMKPFKYASFTVRTHNGAEIEKVAMANDPARNEALSGWTVDHTFHQNKTNAHGLPLKPSQYETDGYSVVNVYITGSYTDTAGVEHFGVATPEAFNGLGDLCDIYFKEPLFDKFPIPGKKYICPPIGATRRLFFPVKPQSDTIDLLLTGVEKSFPEGSRGDRKFYHDDGGNPLIANFDAEESFNAQVEYNATTNVVEKWLSTPGPKAGAAGGVGGHKPTFTVNTNDTRKSILFAGGQGISTDSSGVGLRSADPHKWSIYALVDFTALFSASGFTNGDKAVIFSAGGQSAVSGSTGRGRSQFEFKLQVEKSGGNYELQAISYANDTGTTQKEKKLIAAVTQADHSGWQIVSWTGNSETGEFNLYVNGKIPSAQASINTPTDTHSTALGKHGMVWHIGHDGTNPGSISGIGQSSSGRAFAGRISQIMMFNEFHDSDEVQKSEAYFAVKNPNEGTVTLQSKLPDNHIAASKSVLGSVVEAGMTPQLYLGSVNTTDKMILQKMDSQIAHESLTGEAQIDKGSDRCAAQWVSDHVCVDKSSQTLLNVSCAGTGEGFTLG